MWSRNIGFKKAFILASLFLFFSCAPSKKILTPPPIEEYKSKIKDTMILTKRGSYSSLKEAFQIYQNLSEFPPYRRFAQENMVRIGLLLCLRESEIGILNDSYFTAVSKLIRANPHLARYLAMWKLTATSSTRIRDASYFIGSSEVENFFDWLRENADALATELKEKAEKEEFFTYLYIHMNSEYSYSIKEEDDLTRFLNIHPDSLLIQYKLAIWPQINQKSLETLLHEEPSFQEAHYFLGKIDLMLGRLLSAEKHFLKAFEHFPRSLSLMGSLGKVHFALEEYGRSLEFHEKILKLTPYNRDALLGKAICLSYLGQHEEAIKELDILRTMGTYLMGETYYWLAWNRNELKKYKEAWKDIQNAKHYLIGHHEVHTLAGIIAYELENIREAEDELKESVRLNPSECNALYYLGKIYAACSGWLKSALHFEQAAHCFEGKEISLTRKIREIEASSLSQDRKKKHLKRKRVQVRKTRLLIATCFYNAAAGYFNSGKKEKAFSLAQKASSHKALKQKADELMNRIKKQEKP